MRDVLSTVLFFLFWFSCFKKSLWYDFKVSKSSIGIYLFNILCFKKIYYSDIESLFLYDKTSYKEPSNNTFLINKYENRLFKQPIWLIMKDTYSGSKFITLTPKNDVEFIKEILKVAPHLKCANYE